jgi:hypothetical protein
VGDTGVLTATVVPTNATNKNVTWSSSSTDVATVNNGIVTAIAAGSATITVTTVDGGKTAACSVTVQTADPNAVAVTGVTLNVSALTLTAGYTGVLTATVAPVNATNKNVRWSSSNTDVATVNNGTITAIAAGSATITVTTVNGSKTAYCPVTVIAANKVELVNLQEIIKDMPDGLLVTNGILVFAGMPFMKVGQLNVSIITEDGVKKLKLDGMTQTWGEGLDIRHAASADGNTGVGYKEGDQIYIKGKVTPANGGLMVNASGGGYALVKNIGDVFNDTVILTADHITLIKSGNPQTIRLHYDTSASRIGTIIIEELIVTGSRAEGDGVEIWTP